MREGNHSLSFPALRVKQTLGEFYIASIPAKDLVEITYFDVRRMLRDDREVERYLGIQRPLQKRRVDELVAYVNGPDACFPTGIIIAVPDVCAEYDESSKMLTLSNYMDSEDESERVLYRNIAKVLDGQHRLAGLDGLEDGKPFDLNVAIFIGADISDQANIFATVNLAQTKVNRSLAYDLYELARSRSPQKVAHNIVVTLDRETDSPLHKMVKRLGVATPDRTGETLTQATVVQGILPFISIRPEADRRLYLEGSRPAKLSGSELGKTPLQHLFVDEMDFKITDVFWNYFSAIKDRWPHAWESRERGYILNRSTGFKGFIRFLRHLYQVRFQANEVPGLEAFGAVLKQIDLDDSAFTTDNFPPGSSGEAGLFGELVGRLDP